VPYPPPPPVDRYQAAMTRIPAVSALLRLRHFRPRHAGSEARGRRGLGAVLPTVAAVPQKTLKVVPAPLAIDAVPSAPPALEDRTPTVDCVCGSCGAVLMHADENQVHSLIIQCTVCDAYNSTDAETL
jgi:hypothetical protein